MKNVYADQFMIGNAAGSNELSGLRFQFLNKHFNAVTAENIMKPEALQAQQGVFTFETADRFVDTLIAHDHTMHGHTLVWHSQSPAWMNTGVTSDEALHNMVTHITTVMQHYKGRIHSWDVLNEAIMDGATDPTDWKSSLRNSPWLEALGTDYVELAFRAAQKADPTALLYYNDYNLDYPAKREAVYCMVKELKEKCVKIDGIGMQGHYNMNTSTQNVEDSIKRFEELGVKVSISELDVTVDDASGQETLTPRQELQQAHRYAELFLIFKRYADTIERVTFWGLDDGTSWRGNRFPLPFDQHLHAKFAYFAIIDPVSFKEEFPL